MRRVNGIGAMQQERRNERAAQHIRALNVKVLRIARDKLRFGSQRFHMRQHIAALVEADDRSHPHVFKLGIADHDLIELVTQCLNDGFDMRLGRKCAADRGAFLPRLDGHLLGDFLDEEIELGRAGRGVRREDRGIERIPFGDEAHGFLRNHGMALQFFRCAGRTGERHHILTGEVVEQVAGRTNDKLERTFRKDAGLRDHARQRMGDIGRHRGGLGDDRNAAEQGRREFLQHAPAREIESVDMDRSALQRGDDMLAGKRAGLAQLFNRAVHQEGGVRQFAPALAGIDKQCANATIHVDQVVGACRARLERQLVELVLPFGDVLRELF